MWSGKSLLTFILGFAFPPIWLLFVYFQIQESRKEGSDSKARDIRSRVLSNLYTTSPAACPSCGGTSFRGGVISAIPARGIRSFQFPMSGIASVCNFTCLTCGTKGRYAIAHTEAERGWILLDRYMGGW